MLLTPGIAFLCCDAALSARLLTPRAHGLLFSLLPPAYMPRAPVRGSSLASNTLIPTQHAGAQPVNRCGFLFATAAICLISRVYLSNTYHATMTARAALRLITPRLLARAARTRGRCLSAPRRAAAHAAGAHLRMRARAARARASPLLRTCYHVRDLARAHKRRASCAHCSCAQRHQRVISIIARTATLSGQRAQTVCFRADAMRSSS